jgi:hypothetical protein
MIMEWVSHTSFVERWVHSCSYRPHLEAKRVIAFQEWLPSLPLHLDLYAALKLKPPQFAHLPILLNPDGSKMSKRKGDVRVEDYIVSSSSTFGSHFSIRIPRRKEAGSQFLS